MYWLYFLRGVFINLLTFVYQKYSNIPLLTKQIGGGYNVNRVNHKRRLNIKKITFLKVYYRKSFGWSHQFFVYNRKEVFEDEKT